MEAARLEQEAQDLVREVQRLTQIIVDARKALDHLDGVIAVETWDDDHIPATIRGAAIAVRFRLDRLYKQQREDDPPLPPRHG